MRALTLLCENRNGTKSPTSSRFESATPSLVLDHVDPSIDPDHTPPTEDDMLFFDELRSRFFPPERNFLPAHITMFHKLPPENRPQIEEILQTAARMAELMEVEVVGVRNMGNGVAFVLQSDELERMRADLKTALKPWLVPRDH